MDFKTKSSTLAAWVKLSLLDTSQLYTVASIFPWWLNHLQNAAPLKSLQTMGIGTVPKHAI